MSTIPRLCVSKGAIIIAALTIIGAFAATVTSASQASDTPNPKSKIQNPKLGSPWQRYKLTGSTLNSVDALALNDAWAVGTDGLIAHYDGANWNVVDNSKIIGASPIQCV